MNVDDLVKRQVGDVLKAASNPHAESPKVIVSTLPKDRRDIVIKTAKGVKSISNEVMARGKQRLLELSDEEWDRLVNDE